MAGNYKYTEEVVNKLLNVIREGGTSTGACKYAGITYATLLTWFKKPDFAKEFLKAKIEGKERKRQLRDPLAKKIAREEAQKENKSKPNLLNLDMEQFEKLAVLQCTPHEIAVFFHTTIAQLDALIQSMYQKTLDEYVNEKAKLGNVKLRGEQFRQAMEGNTQMLIWLGKQQLQQVDRPQPEKIQILNLVAQTRDSILALEPEAKAKAIQQLRTAIQMKSKQNEQIVTKY